MSEPCNKTTKRRLARIRAQERRRIAVLIECEASMHPCKEDRECYRSIAMFVRGNGSWEQGERLEARRANPETTADDWDDDRDPDDYCEPADECDHLDAEIDVIEGHLSCSCGYTRWLSGDEIRREAQLQADMMEAYCQQCEDEENAKPL